MIKPYYEEPNITIYNGDCLEVMKELPDKSVDLVLTSPPYDDLRSYETFIFDFKNVAIEIFRLLKSGGILVWVVGDKTNNGSESGESFKQALYFKEIGFDLHDTMIYKKDSIVFPDFNRYYQCFEFMFVFSKDKPKTFNPIKDRSNKMAGYTKTGKWERQTNGEIKYKNKTITTEPFSVRNNIWEYGIGYMKSAKDKYVFEHPAIFPEKLAMDHINSWSNPGDTILDPFLGSGTTARACKDLNRKCIGIEISKKYCDIAVRRLGQEVLNFEKISESLNKNG